MEQVLVNVRDGARIRVHAGLAAHQARIARAVAAVQAHRHAWLQNAVAGCHAAARGIQLGAVQRMRHGRGKAARGVALQLGVGVQGDDVLHLLQHRGVAHHRQKAGMAVATQQRVQGRELAALALKAHPYALLRIPQARAVEQKKGVLASARVFAVQRLYAGLRQRQQGGIAVLVFAGCIGPIGQQAVVQVGVLVGQETYLQRFDQRLHASQGVEHGGHHHQAARAGRQPLGKFHARQHMRCGQQGGQPVHQGHGQLAAGQERQWQQQPPHRAGQALAAGQAQQTSAAEQGQHGNRAQVQRHRVGTQPALQGQPHRQAQLQCALQHRQTDAYQVVADVAVRAAHTRRAVQRMVRQLHHLARHLCLGNACQARALFHHVAVAVAGGEVHARVDTAGVLAQGGLHQALGFDKIAPVRSAEQAQAGNAVADADLVDGLALGFGLHHLLNGLTGFTQALLHPGQRQGQGRAMALQAARQLGDKGIHQGGTGARHVRDHQDQALGVVLGHLQHLVRPGTGAVALEHALGHARAYAAQVFNQGQAQHDGNGPELAQLELRHILVGRHKAVQVLRVDPAVTMRNHLQRNVIDARQALGGATGQQRQLTAVPLGEVRARGEDLLFNEIKIVQQPLAGGRDAPLLAHRLQQQRTGLLQHQCVGIQALQQLVVAASAVQAVRLRQGLAVALHLLGAEQLGTQRHLGRRAARCRAV